MNKQKFDAIYNSCIQEFIKDDKDGFLARLNEFNDNKPTVDSTSLAIFMHAESLRNSAKFTYCLLSKLFITED
jgi:hypothetical protein